MSIFDYLIHDVKVSHPDLYNKAINFEQVSDFEIMLYFEDGRKVLYNTFNETLRFYGADYDYNKRSDKRIKMDFANRLKTIMSFKAIDQTKLSELSGISQQTISNYISGKTMPDIVKLNKLARALDVHINDLLKD